MKFKRLERVGFKNFNDFRKIVKLIDKEKGIYLVVPDGSDQHWTMKENELLKLKREL